MIISKLKEALICFKAGRVTLPYPFQPHEPEGEFRGRLVVDVEKCVGCGGCAEVCPPRCIEISDPSHDKRVIEFFLERCTYCARCVEVCPEDAITASKEYETATNDRNDMHIRLEVFMSTCRRCGRCYEPPTPLDRLTVTGFRPPVGEEQP